MPSAWFHISRNHHMSMKWSMDLSVDSFQYCPFPGERTARGIYLLRNPSIISSSVRAFTHFRSTALNPFSILHGFIYFRSKMEGRLLTKLFKGYIATYFSTQIFSPTFFNKSDHFQVSTNWTWSAQIQKWKPRFHSNVPWWTTLEDFEISPF